MSGIESTMVLRKSPVLYRLGSIEIEAVIGVLKYKYTRRSTNCSWYAFKTLCTQTKTILSEAITQDLILFDKKSWMLTYQTFLK
jgi:hypothetical protein